MAKADYDAARAARQIDALVNRSKVRLYSHSPNDVLVQIALPLILILAICTRLTMMANSLAQQEGTGPAVMELWKQQVILRIDRVLGTWEAEAHLARFQDFSRVKWAQAWPDDPTYQRLCDKARELNDPAELRSRILAEAIAAQTAVAGSGLASVVPERDLELAPGSAEAAYAESYISQRLAKWHDQIEGLHWETVAYVAERLPLGTQTGADDARRQLQQIARELESRGYPLMDSIRAEYGKERGAS